MQRTLLPVGFVLVIVIAFVSWLAPDFRQAMQRSRQKRTMAEMRSLATALEALATDRGWYAVGPVRVAANDHDYTDFSRTTRVSAGELQRVLVPKYIDEVPRFDGWGNEFDIRVGDHDARGHAQAYAIRSFGADGKPDATRYESRPVHRFTADLVYANGTFVWYPEGI